MPAFCGQNLATSMTSGARKNEAAIEPPNFTREKVAGNKANDIAAFYAKRGLYVIRKEE